MQVSIIFLVTFHLHIQLYIIYFWATFIIFLSLISYFIFMWSTLGAKENYAVSKFNIIIVVTNTTFTLYYFDQ